MGSLHSALVALIAGCVLVFVAAWLLGAVYFAAKRGTGPGGWSDGLRRALPRRIMLIAGVYLVSLLIRHTPRSWRHHLEFWQPELALLGAALAVAATAWLLWARWVLGTMWASVPMVRDHHELRTDGPYGMVRHPIYAGLLGLVTGAMLACGFGVWVVILALAVPWLLRRVQVEDRLMADRFGVAYEAYRAGVPALIPSVGPARNRLRRAVSHH